MATNMKIDSEISRRDFLKGTAGLSFTVAISSTGAGLLLPATGNAQMVGSTLSAWLTIAKDGVITILTPGAEMGQGSMTSVPLMLAEEMDADWDMVKLDWAPADKEIYGYGSPERRSMSITGSRAVRSYFDIMRTAGAQVRKVLLEAAAKEWGVPVSELKTEPSVVIHAASNRRIGYGEIASFSDLPSTMPEVTKADFKKPSAYRLIGKSQPRRDMPSKVNGTAEFSMDIKLPGMLYATTLHSPAHGGAPQSWNESDVTAMKGIRHTVKLPTGVAIVGDSFVDVIAARNKLNVLWDKTISNGYNSEAALDNDYDKVAADPASKSTVVDDIGNTDLAFANAARTYKADFRSDYGYHAQMEPLNAVARMNEAGDHIEVWDGTQSPARCRQSVAEAMGFNEEQVTVNQCYIGGGFGRRSLADYTVEAALVAREIKTPVKLIWTREEDVAYGMFRPQNYQCLEAAVDNSGTVTGWRHCIVGDGGSLLSGGMKIDAYYKVPNQHIDRRGASHGMRLKHWRAVSHPFNIFAIEGFVDQIAVAEGIDPIAFRMDNMAITPKGRKVFDKVVEMSDWHGKRPNSRELGVSITERSGSLGAAVVEISIDKSIGKIKVHKVWMAVDGGLVVQPDAARANIESAIIWGISSNLHERLTVRNGVVEQSNYHNYQVTRMSDAPEELHIDFVNAGADEPTGLGEIGNPPIGAAIAHAFFRLTGKRLTHMPFTQQRVKAALNA
jgi:isoquinoline 1-oxidoreductase beta subunit